MENKSAGVTKNYESHGLSGIPEYNIWKSIKLRCRNKNDKDYHNYGAIGIDVSDSWFNSFTAFYSDMGSRPSKTHTIERKENNKGYSKENCVWATRKEQAINRRTTMWLDYNGMKITRQGLADILGVTRDIVKNYINKGETVNQIVDKFKSKKYVQRKSRLLCMGKGF